MNKGLTFLFFITFYNIDKRKFHSKLYNKKTYFKNTTKPLVVLSQSKHISMTFNSTPLFVLVSIVLLSLSPPVYSQMCVGKSKTSITKTNNLTEKSKQPINSKPSKKKKIRIPDNYRPPVANQKLITFPETVATRNKQKKLLKKRKRTKNKGCIAANM